jgi:undecaprenyl-diphosphatase
VQGPAELLPVSSSGHLVLLGSRDKSFEVFLHAGSAAALLLALRDEVVEIASGLDGERLVRIGLTLAPAAIAGVLFEDQIEAKLGTRSVALAQVAGGAALIAADLAPADRAHADATPRDALVIGLAQACALIPGVSRNGATLTAARLLRFRRDAASRMSRHAALPVIAGATALKLVRIRTSFRQGPVPKRKLAAGAIAAFVSSLAAARLVPRNDRLESYRPFGMYRIALGLAFLFNGRDD